MEGTASRTPVAAHLPALLAEDPFLSRFTAGLDDVLAPVVATLDGLTSYVDPALAPEDFLGWLAGWVGLDLDPHWPVDVRRAVLGAAAVVQSARGTAAGLAEEIRLLTGATVQVCDPGGVAWSATPGGALPGVAAGVVVRVLHAPAQFADETGDARARLDRATRAAVPAHLPVTVEVST